MTGLYLHRSQRIEALLSPLGDGLRERPPSDPFVAARVVVGSRGMENWLRHGIADTLGICANIDFVFPGAFLGRVRAAFDEAAVADDPWSPDLLAWPLVDVLRTLADEEPALATWRASLGARDTVVGPDAWRLARSVADVFDRYAWFRAEWCEAWTRDLDVPELVDLRAAGWQRRAWRALVARLGPCPTVASQRTLPDKIAAAASIPADLQQIHVFGVTSLPPALLRVLSALAQRARVDIYMPSASPLYWADDLDARRARRPDAQAQVATQNPVLTAFGRVGRDAQHLLTAIEAIDGVEAFEDDDRDHALARVQADIAELASPPSERSLRPVLKVDGSIQVHACHGALRQVEALRDTLLHLFAAPESTLEPRDVAVLTPDPDTFIPLVLSVFASEPGGPPPIPVRATGRVATQLDMVTDLALRLLLLADQRATHDDVSAIVAMEGVRTRFSLDEDDVIAAAATCARVGIRWGRDGVHRVRHLGTDEESNTWRWGIDRLMLGAILPEVPLHAPQWAEAAPWDDMEGGEAQRMGRYAHACLSVLETARRFEAPSSLPGWSDLLLAATEALLDPAVSSKAGGHRGRAAIDALARHGDSVAEARTVHDVLERLAAPSAAAEERAAGGTVQVGALTPMRSVPYRVVAVLGLDDKAFPRVSEPVPWDLVASRARVGDRNPRDEDRYLFLEAMLAARDNFLLYGTARDAQTNAVRPWATPLQEFVDALDTMYSDARGEGWATASIIAHPVAPYVPRVFATKPLAAAAKAPWSFDRVLLEATSRAREGVAPRDLRGPVDGISFPGVLDMSALARWVARPVTQYARETLRIAAPFALDELNDREPIAIDVRELLPPLLESMRSDPALRALSERSEEGAEERLHDAYLARARRRGVLPFGGPGDAAFHGAWRRTRALTAELADIDAVSPERVRVALEVGDTLVHGTVHDLRSKRIVFVTPYRLKNHDILEQWVRVVVLTAAGIDLAGATMLGWEKEPTFVHLTPPTAERARELLSAYIAMAKSASRQALPMTADATYLWAYKPSVPALEDLWNPARRPFPMTDEERLVRYVLGDALPFVDASGAPLAAFTEGAALLWRDLLTGADGLDKPAEGA